MLARNSDKNEDTNDGENRMTSLENVAAALNPARPLLIVDADEVLLRFVEHLEAFFPTRGFELRLTSFQLSGNIYEQKTNTVAPPQKVTELIGSFFDNCVDTVPAVDGAASALENLSEQYEVVVLTNVPHAHRARREAALWDMGFKYPVLSNAGEKGPAVKALKATTTHHVAFVDDLPPQLASVANHAPGTHLVHFVADPRLAAMITKAPDAHVRIDDWATLQTHLGQLGQQSDRGHR